MAAVIDDKHGIDIVPEKGGIRHYAWYIKGGKKQYYAPGGHLFWRHAYNQIARSRHLPGMPADESKASKSQIAAYYTARRKQYAQG